MIKFKYEVQDDGNRIKSKEFDNFKDAFNYAQEGLITFIFQHPYQNGKFLEEDANIVWCWDDTYDFDEAAERVKKEEAEVRKLYDDLTEVPTRKRTCAVPPEATPAVFSKSDLK